MVKDCFPNILNVLFVPIVELNFIVNPISDQRDLPTMSVMVMRAARPHTGRLAVITE